MTLFATLSRFMGFGATPKISFTQRIALGKQRNDLANLTAAQLEDIGVSQSEADYEARRPIWDAPNFWYK